MQAEAAMEKIKELAAGKLGLPKEKMGPTTNFFTELGADSLKMLGFISMLEKEFDIEVEDDDLQQLYCVENVWKVILSKQPNA